MMSTNRVSSARTALAARAARPAPARAPARARRAPSTPRPPVSTAASKDFDAVLAEWAAKFERMPSDKRVPVVGYSVGAVAAFVFIEKILHTPGLDILLGGPVQIVGILALPTIVTRYVLDGKDWMQDAGEYVDNITSRLPGLKK